MSFKENGFEIVRNVIEPQLLLHLKTEFEMIRDINFFISGEKNPYSFGDGQSPNSFSIYSATCFESLSLILNQKMNEITNLNLVPTYTYARIYYKGAILKPHTDRPSCEYSTTICIDSADLWDFYIKNKNNKTIKLKLNPGDMCVYSGCELEHWREPYQGNQQIQCFLHYVNSQGPHKNHKFDKRPMLGIGTKISTENIKNKKNNLMYQ
jgi:hypothetical protein